jgi:hypothetical protein
MKHPRDIHAWVLRGDRRRAAPKRLELALLALFVVGVSGVHDS